MGFLRVFFFYFDPDLQMKRASTILFFQFELMAEASINQVLNISKNLL